MRSTKLINIIVLIILMTFNHTCFAGLLIIDDSSIEKLIKPDSTLQNGMNISIPLSKSESAQALEYECIYENITSEIVAGEHEATLIITLLSIAALIYILWEYGGIKKAVEKEATS